MRKTQFSDSMVTQTDLCTYWMDIIHISNFVAVDEMCYLPAWHLAVDFQFTIFAPFFLLAFHYSTVLGTDFCKDGYKTFDYRNNSCNHCITYRLGTDCIFLFTEYNSEFSIYRGPRVITSPIHIILCFFLILDMTTSWLKSFFQNRGIRWLLT